MRRGSGTHSRGCKIMSWRPARGIASAAMRARVRWSRCPKCRRGCEARGGNPFRAWCRARSGLLLMAAIAMAVAADPALINPRNRIDPAAPEWRELAASFADRPAIVAEFEETRHFPFRRTPVIVKGTVRVSGEHGLSLQYPGPAERIVIVDRQGMFVREPGGDRAASADPRAAPVNEALLHILRLDLAALSAAYEVHGRREGAAWVLALVPRAEAVRRAIGDIFVEGEGAAVRRIELRRSPRQHVAIAIGPARDVTFSAAELRRFFR